MRMRLKTIRKINNYTQKDIADILDVTQRTYSKYETRELTLKIEQLIILRNFYKVSTDYLLGLVDRDKKPVSVQKLNYDKFINNLKYYRYENDYSQKDLAKLLNCSASIISMIENKNSVVQIDMLISLAKIYNVKADNLLFVEDE